MEIEVYYVCYTVYLRKFFTNSRFVKFEIEQKRKDIKRHLCTGRKKGSDYRLSWRIKEKRG